MIENQQLICLVGDMGKEWIEERVGGGGGRGLVGWG